MENDNGGEDANVTFGEIAYRAYCASVGGVSINGDPLPEFANQREHIRCAWEAAGRRVAASTLEAVSLAVVDANVIDSMVTGVEQIIARKPR